MRRSESILVVDDEQTLRGALVEAFTDAGQPARAVADGASCMKELDRGDVAVVLLDVWLRPSNENGLTLLPTIVREHPEVRVIMMTAINDVDAVVTAMKGGAYHYIVKGGADFMEQVREKVAAALEDPGRERQAEVARSSPQLIARSPKMLELLQGVRMAVRSSMDVTVLIRGETGAGKDMIARELHYLSANANGPFVSIDVAAVRETLVESELFGHERGAFTDAKTQKTGLVELAAGGTLLLDEIGDLTPELQGKLLRALENKRFRRLGGTTEIPIRARVVAATWRDLEAAMRDGVLRRDLYYRLMVVVLNVPPLRERPEDIVAITHDYLQRHAEKMNQPVRSITPDAEAALLAYAWPGNVRELRNKLESILIMTEGPIERRHLPAEVLSPAAHNGHVPALAETPPSIVTERSLKDRPLTMEEGEKLLIADAMRYTGGNKTKAAEALGIGRHTLGKKIKEHGLDR